MKKYFLIPLLILSILIPSFCFAAEDVPTTTSIEPREESVSSEELLENVDVCTDSYTLSNLVDGNVHIVAKDVTIDNIVGGNVFICADNVNVTSNCLIQGAAYICANSIVVNGTITDLYAVAKNVTISSQVFRDANIIVKDNFTLIGTVGRNLNIVGGKTFCFQDEKTSDNQTPRMGHIAGKLRYVSNRQIQIPEGVLDSTDNIEFIKLNVGKYIVYAIATITLLFALVYLFFNIYNSKIYSLHLTTKNTEKAIQVGLITFVSLILLLIACICLKLLPITLFLIITFALLLVISQVLVCILITNLVLKKPNKILRTLISFVFFVLITGLYLVPILNCITSIVLLILGIGYMYIASSDKVATKADNVPVSKKKVKN